MPEIEHGDKPLPRNGSDVYSLPATYEAVTGETIEAQQHNDPLEDLEQDANTPRPVVAGGTGGETAIEGADNLSTKGSNIASATTTDIGAATGVYAHITGTTTITGFGTKTAGVKRILVFDGILTLTHNGTSLILPTAANITTAAGDVAHMVSEGAGNWKCVAYIRADGSPLTPVGTSPTIVTPTLTLKQSAAPTPTAEGDIQWDTDDNRLVVGDGAATQVFSPNPASTVQGDIEYYTDTNVKARLAKGTAGQELRMNAGATALEWFTPAPADYGAGNAALSYGAVGTYVFAYRNNATNLSAGSTYAGSTLTPASMEGPSEATGAQRPYTAGAALSGTWRAMGEATSDYHVSLFLRTV